MRVDRLLPPDSQLIDEQCAGPVVCLIACLHLPLVSDLEWISSPSSWNFLSWALWMWMRWILFGWERGLRLAAFQLVELVAVRRLCFLEEAFGIVPLHIACPCTPLSSFSFHP